MSEYLSKEEIMQWRRSVEKCTLEEYAARMGKQLETQKETHDLIDIINNGENVVQVYNLSEEERSIRVYVRPKTEMSTVKKASKPPKIENFIAVKEVEEKSVIIDEIEEKVEEKPIKIEKTEEKPKEVIVETKEIQVDKETVKDDLDSIEGLTLRKPLTDREMKVFEYFSQNKNKVVFAKDIADLLELKRDYIYKYIKNLRAKIVEDIISNSDEGGFILKI
jgi:hypothetical protein